MTKHKSKAVPENEANEKDNTQKIQALRDMISNAEKTIQSAKAMLLQLEGKKKVGRKRKIEEVSDGTAVEGTFDGQTMIGTDGRQYPVPANYASKSKLVEGDMLKLTITPEGSFIYKQIGPVERKHALGIISQDEGGNYRILADGKIYKVLLASVTYFKGEPGDEVAIVLPRDIEASWAAIENILQKNSGFGGTSNSHWMPPRNSRTVDEEVEDDIATEDTIASEENQEAPKENETSKNPDELKQEIVDEWIKDLEKIENEIQDK